MKRWILFFISLYMGLAGARAQSNKFDLNEDGDVNITDVIMLVNHILDPTTSTDIALCEAVDLGLPSGTKWASCNVGATKPEECGGYYAWGETDEKDFYAPSTYIHCDGSFNPSYYDIGSDISGTEYDVAHVKWGGKWCMPTWDHIKELLDNCTNEWISQNGVNGLKFTSNKNGNSIFLPAAGFHWYSLYDDFDSGGYYWSSSQEPESSIHAHQLYFNEAFAGRNSFIRTHGLSVRPVLSPNNTDENGYDLNDDGDVNVTDVIDLVNYILALSNGNETNATGEAVDLGLPSGIKWATCNVGATKPEEYGGYYAWGETEEKEDYSWETYRFYDMENERCQDLGLSISGTE